MSRPKVAFKLACGSVLITPRQFGPTTREAALAVGLDWHWDLEGTGLDFAGYRAVLRSIFKTAGFREVHTSEPNIAMHTTNLLLARVGSEVPAGRRAAFDAALFIPPWQRAVVPPLA